MIHFLVLLLATGALAVPYQLLNHRVIGGQDAYDGEFPYQVSIRLHQRHYCGGSIIDYMNILSAAHCFPGFHPEVLSVIAGSIHIDGKNGWTSKVVGYRLHEGFNSISVHNDIAIVRLSQPIAFTNKIYPINLANVHVSGGVDSVLSGWGIFHSGMSPQILQRTNLRTISSEECQKGHPDYTILNEQLCTSTYFGSGACNGDSGGPLAAGNTQIGIVSWGIPCAIGRPDVFTRISAYIDWIRKSSQ